MGKSHPKSWSRRAALQVLYSAEITNTAVSELLAKDCAVVLESEEQELACPDAYAISLLNGVEAHREEIDQMVDSSSENWAISRMPIMDRSILRIAVYEMMFESSLSLSVSIDEAVELAKKYGGEDESHRFVNGVLGQIAKRLEGEATDEAAAGEAADAAGEAAGADEAAGAAGEAADAGEGEAGAAGPGADADTGASLEALED